MKILIIEDEEQAAKRLKKIVSELLPGADITDALQSVESAVAWLSSNPMPDLAFMDIHLADGNSFQIFEKVKISCPVIFTTAYHDYALQAFKVNSIDYILKPFDKDDISIALKKLQAIQGAQAPVIDYSAVLKTLQTTQYRERFVVKFGDNLKSVNTPDIAYFYTENKANFLCTNDNRRYPIDHNLDHVEEMLNPKQFFRINRQFIIGHHAIDDMKAYTRARVIVTLRPPSKLDTVVAVDRAQDFRAWLAGE
ncbi:MAG: LytTR family DNA-binding domain-containing protein [Ferruginibacter sp.]